MSTGKAPLTTWMKTSPSSKTAPASPTATCKHGDLKPPAEVVAKRRANPVSTQWPCPPVAVGTGPLPYRSSFLDVGDADTGVGLVTAVDRTQVGGGRLHLVGVAQPPAVNSPHPGDTGRQSAHNIGGFTVVPEHEHVQIHLLD